MRPELFHAGNLTVHSYGFFIVAGMLLAYFFLRKQWKKIGLGNEAVNVVFLLAFAGIVAGGKLFYYLESPGFYIQNPGAMFRSFGNGFVFYGSFLVTIPILYLFFKKRKLDPWEQFDLVGICGVMVHAIGKLGCFMAGCCYGKVCTNSWYSALFTDARSAARPLNTYLYATQVWDSLLLFTILAILLLVRPGKQFHGQLFLLYAIIYAVGRFFSENFRGDEVRGFVLNGLLSHSQFMAVIILVFSGGLYFFRLKGHRIYQAGIAKGRLN